MFSEKVSQLFGNQTPSEFTGDLQFCNVCGGLVHPQKQDQHTNYHLTIQRVLEELAELATGGRARSSNVWLDLENLKNGELT